MSHLEKTYGLIGKSLKHSFSQKYFSKKFDIQGVKSAYLNYELNNISELKDLLSRESIQGLNVTLPYKEEVLPFLDDLDEVVKKIGAVNTIKIRNGRAKGYNTDVFGFKQMIKPFFKPIHEKALILGTGGASKAVAYVLEELGCEVNFLSRTPKGDNQFAYEEVNPMMIDFHKIIVNTTPVGMFPNIEECIDLPYHALTTNHLVVDLIYNPLETKFLFLSKNHGAVVLNGLTMLEQQAEEAWRIWNEE